MCGIGGIVQTNKQPISIKQLKSMADVIKHRGPDDEGYWVWGQSRNEVYDVEKLKLIDNSSATFSVGLCHRRLAIIDLRPQGRQPMSDADGRYTMTYNGEIYNYLELKKELEAHFEFRTETDSEVIIAAYQHWGEECVHHFNGMWSFAIVDSQEKKLFASRDRFGIKPFCYYKDDQTFAFGSEYKQLVAFTDRKINAEAISQYIAYGDVNTSEQSCFADLYQLLPGHSLSMALDNFSSFKVYPYYHLNQIGPTEAKDLSFSEALSKFKKLFSDSVKLRMRSDVPVGACLSGGLDSSAIVAHAQEMVNTPVQTFTSCFEDPELNEGPLAEQVALHVGAAPHQVFPNLEDLHKDIDQLIWHQDEPFRHSSNYAQWCVMKLAKDSKVKVLLDGQGADEALSGYHWYIPVLIGEKLRKFQWILAWRHWKNLNSTKVLTATERLTSVLAKSIFFALGFLSRDKRAQSKYHTSNIKYLRTIGFRQSVHENQMQDLAFNLASLLRFEDRSSMAFSIESRTPFLDIHLIEFLLSLPVDLRFHKGWTKSILRFAVDKKLPESVVWNPGKKGFVTPHQKFLDSLYEKPFEDVFGKEELSYFFDLKKLREGFATKKLPQEIFWRAYCVNRWIDRFGLCGIA